MKYFAVINGKNLFWITALNLEEAKNKAMIFCDCSLEVIIREIEKTQQIH